LHLKIAFILSHFSGGSKSAFIEITQARDDILMSLRHTLDISITLDDEEPEMPDGTLGTSSGQIDEKLTEDTKTFESTVAQQIYIRASKSILIGEAKEAKASFNQAMTAWDQAWIAELDENSDRSAEASQKFNEAKQLFEKASKLVPQNTTYSNWSSVCSLKIAGNSEFEQGVQRQLEGKKLELEDKKLQQQAKIQEANSKYEEARTKFEQAKGKFEVGLEKSGDQRLQSSIKITNDKIEEVDKILK
jgi:tetratricopeptide (TPR) repeat protein